MLLITSSMGLLSEILPDLAVAGVQAVTRGGPRRQYKWNKKAAEDANRMNRENSQWLLEQNKRLQDEQRAYDSPSAQRARYIAAGVNPNIGFGGSGGNAGGAFPIDAGNVGSVNIQPPSASYPDIAGSFLAAGQMSAQTQLAEQRVQESRTNQALKEVMIDIQKTNPMLQPWVADWVATSMSETARLKTFEARSWMGGTHGGTEPMNITKRVNAEIEAMSQRLGLNVLDMGIKNKIFESKEFENAIKQIQVKWLEDAEMTPEHVRQGLMLILSKMIGR